LILASLSVFVFDVDVDVDADININVNNRCSTTNILIELCDCVMCIDEYARTAASIRFEAIGKNKNKARVSGRCGYE
jgi:hypothetical protein